MAHLSVRRGAVVPRTASWTPSSVWTAPAFCRPPSISASSKRADSAPISCSASRAKLLDPRSHTRQPRWCILGHQSVGVQLGLSTLCGGSSREDRSQKRYKRWSKTRTSVRRGTCPPGTHTPSTCGFSPSICASRALSSANVRRRTAGRSCHWGSAGHEVHTCQAGTPSVSSARIM
jgi:hypothetical protein